MKVWQIQQWKQVKHPPHHLDLFNRNWIADRLYVVARLSSGSYLFVSGVVNREHLKFTTHRGPFRLGKAERMTCDPSDPFSSSSRVATKTVYSEFQMPKNEYKGLEYNSTSLRRIFVHRNLWSIPQTESPVVEYFIPFLGEMLCIK